MSLYLFHCSQHHHWPFTSLHFSQHFTRQHRRPLRDHPHTQQPPGRWNQGTPSNPTRQLCWAKSTSLDQTSIPSQYKNAWPTTAMVMKLNHLIYVLSMSVSFFINLTLPSFKLKTFPPKQLTTHHQNDVRQASPSLLP